MTVSAKILGTMTVLMTLAGGCGSTQVRTVYRYAGHDVATMVEVNIVPGPMPPNETFSGSYHSSQIGDVFLEQTGDSVVGTYAYDRGACHATGRIEGQARGNLVRFTWTESQRACGRIAPLTGKGYFLFWLDSNTPIPNGRVNGEWGVGANESGGGPWSLFRDRVRRQRPTETTNNEREGVFDQSPSTPSTGSSGGAAPVPAPLPP